jgi:hypothetical protein
VVLPETVSFALVALQLGTFAALHVEAIRRFRVGLHQQASSEQEIPSRHFSDNHGDVIEPVDSVPVVFCHIVTRYRKQQ